MAHIIFLLDSTRKWIHLALKALETVCETQSILDYV